jgi:hypothetical protein
MSLHDAVAHIVRWSTTTTTITTTTATNRDESSVASGEDHCQYRGPLSMAGTSGSSLSTAQGTIVDGRDQANQQTKKYSFPYYLSQIEFMRPKVMKNEGVSGSN